MTNRERTLAVLNYQPYDRLPLAHFGYWNETLEKWAVEGHITMDEAKSWGDGNPTDVKLSRKLGFDMNYYSVFIPHSDIMPVFEREVLKVHPDGSREVVDAYGITVLERDGAVSIAKEIDHILKDRKSWEQHYLPRLQFSMERIDSMPVLTENGTLPFSQGGKEYLQQDKREFHYGLYAGSLFGNVRNWWGLENVSYLYADDEDLFDEVIDVAGTLCYQCVKAVLETGAKFDFVHYWEDICFKNGPLINPEVFHEKVGPQYKRMTELVNQYGLNIISLDCDGLIDKLIPTWIENGVNTMFPIEVGTWDANIKPWREKFGRELRGVGGMNKNTFAYDIAAIDAEIERLKPLVDLGGYIPCPDHRIPPDAKWELVQYYCETMRETFSDGKYGNAK